jgi:DNA-binding CsgD family transcriptional regulator
MPSTGVLPGNLPRQLTSFIGRERELRNLKELLERSRLLTLTGPGGSGKTRLGLQLAASVGSGFPDGVYFVALAPVGNPDLVLSSIAQGVGLGDVGNRPLLERLCSHLESARVLLLLDNFEHLAVSAPAVVTLLQATAELRIVVTSRAPLHVSGEQEFEVPPLQVPDRPTATAAAVAGCESVRLFMERAQAACPGLVLNEENAASIAGVTAKSSRAVLFGLSDGGRAAVAFAAACPGRTRGLILYGTSYRGPRAALLRRYRSMVRHWGQGQIIDLIAPSLAGPQACREAGAFERAAASPAMAAALIESLGLIDVRDLMSDLAVPTLVLHRLQDIIPVADARMVAGQIPGATLKILPGRDHLPWAGDWTSVAGEILAFIAQVAPAGKQPTRDGRPGARPPRPALGWPSLTEAELPVVRLAAEGHTNADIADRLCLSRYTVETHLKHVFAKLGVESRAELAALAAGQPESTGPNT